MELRDYEEHVQDYHYPKVSVIVPTYNSVNLIALTLDSILSQEYPDLEVIVIDGGSKDRTVETVKSYRDERIFIHTVTGQLKYEMLNNGISQAKGLYFNCLFPGDFYLFNRTLKHVMAMAVEKKFPEIVYGGTLLRDGRSEAKSLLREMSLSLLKKGQQATSLQGCFFLKERVEAVGKFNPSYEMRGGFDLMCRLYRYEPLRAEGTKRILVDYDMRWVTRKSVLRHFTETYRTLLHHFGFFSALLWFFHQKDMMRVLRLWFKGVKSAFIRGA